MYLSFSEDMSDRMVVFSFCLLFEAALDRLIYDRSDFDLEIPLLAMEKVFAILRTGVLRLLWWSPCLESGVDSWPAAGRRIASDLDLESDRSNPISSPFESATATVFKPTDVSSSVKLVVGRAGATNSRLSMEISSGDPRSRDGSR